MPKTSKNRFISAISLPLISRLLKSKKGNVALVFALLLVPMVGLIAAGIDLSRVNSMQSELQGITDAAVLAAAKSSTDSTTATKEIADTYLKAHIAKTGLVNVTTNMSNTTTETNGKQLNYSATGYMSSSLMKLFGNDNMSVTAQSSAVANSSGSEVVFVLDTTASMSENSKITNLKSAVNATLQTLVDANGNNTNNVKIGVVPFNVQFKVSPNVNMANIDWGPAWTYQGCDYSFSNQSYWPHCEISWRNMDIVCYNATNRDACKATSKFFDKPVYQSNGRYYYEQWVKAYEIVGSNYKIYTHKMTWWWANSSCSSYYTDETGQHCNGWTGGGSGLTEDSQTNYTSAVSGNGNGNGEGNEGNGNGNGGSGLDQYTSKPSGFNNMNFLPKVETSTWDGFGGQNARNWNYTWYNSNLRNASLPASTDKKESWTGCMIDRAQNYDTNAQPATTGTPNSYYPARRCYYEPLQPILPLTTDVAAVRNKVNALQPAGYTNITIGIQWGMEVLSPNEPMVGGAPFGSSDAKKYMVIITDGYNNQNRFSSTASAVDARTKLACEAAKAKGITLFVVRLEDGDSQLLRECASQPPYYYDLASSSQLTGALQDMFTSISKLRIVN